MQYKHMYDHHCSIKTAANPHTLHAHIRHSSLDLTFNMPAFYTHTDIDAPPVFSTVIMFVYTNEV